MFYVYIMMSETSGSYYVGQTEDVVRRVGEHNRGEEKSTRSHRPWKLVYTESFSTRGEAVSRERGIKSRKKRAYIEKLISERGAAR